MAVQRVAALYRSALVAGGYSVSTAGWPVGAERKYGPGMRRASGDGVASATARPVSLYRLLAGRYSGTRHCRALTGKGRRSGFPWAAGYLSAGNAKLGRDVG